MSDPKSVIEPVKQFGLHKDIRVTIEVIEKYDLTSEDGSVFIDRGEDVIQKRGLRVTLGYKFPYEQFGEVMANTLRDIDNRPLNPIKMPEIIE